MRNICKLLAVLALAGGLTACKKDKGPEVKSPATTLNATGITYSSAVLHGKVSLSSEQLSSVIIGFIYSEDANPSTENGTTLKVTDIASDHSFSMAIDGLIPSTTYYYAAYVKYSSGISEYGEVKSFVTEAVPDYSFGCDAVDLGLSVKWAAYNVGATAPEEYGSYFAWGETKEKSDYSPETYKWGVYVADAFPLFGMTKYTGDAEGGDGLKNLLPEDDAATVNWGAKWRMPTIEEIVELFDEKKCEIGWDADKKGYTIKSLTTGNSIFLPAAGCYNGSELIDTEKYGAYISSTLAYHNQNIEYDHPYASGVIQFWSDGDWVWYIPGYRYMGATIRAVTDY